MTGFVSVAVRFVLLSMILAGVLLLVAAGLEIFAFNEGNEANTRSGTLWAGIETARRVEDACEERQGYKSKCSDSENGIINGRTSIDDAEKILSQLGDSKADRKVMSDFAYSIRQRMNCDDIVEKCKVEPPRDDTLLDMRSDVVRKEGLAASLCYAAGILLCGPYCLFLLIKWLVTGKFRPLWIFRLITS